MSYSRLNRQLLSVTARLTDAIADKTGVLCECRLIRTGIATDRDRLAIIAKDYSDYVLARAVAVNEFHFDPATIAFVRRQHDAAPNSTTEAMA